VALAGSRWAEKVQHFAALDEGQLGQGQDAVLVERRLERKVKAGERLDGREPGHHQRGPDPPVLAQRELFGQQGVDGFERGDLAPLDAPDRGVHDLEGARHLQPDKRALDALNQGGNDLGLCAHHAPP
jgi:hypothetical protein